MALACLPAAGPRARASSRSGRATGSRSDKARGARAGRARREEKARNDMPGSSSTAHLIGIKTRQGRQPRQRNSTARQLDSYSTPRHMKSASTGSTGARHTKGARQELDMDLDRARQGSTAHRASTAASTAPRQRSAPRRSLDSSTARQPGLKTDCAPCGGVRVGPTSHMWTAVRSVHTDL